jgi:hypothetical protein
MSFSLTIFSCFAVSPSTAKNHNIESITEKKPPLNTSITEKHLSLPWYSKTWNTMKRNKKKLLITTAIVIAITGVMIACCRIGTGFRKRLELDKSQRTTELQKKIESDRLQRIEEQLEQFKGLYKTSIYIYMEATKYSQDFLSLNLKESIKEKIQTDQIMLTQTIDEIKRSYNNIKGTEETDPIRREVDLNICLSLCKEHMNALQRSLHNLQSTVISMHIK